MNAPVRSMRRWVGDTLVNLITGLGTARDKTQADQFGITELTQPVLEAMYRGDWVARKIVKCPADDATREWRAWQADNDQIELIEEVERKYHIQLRTRQALIKARLYGGAAFILGVDDGKDPSQELDIETVKKDSLKFVHAVSRHELGSEGPGLEDDLMSPYYGQPKMYVRHVKGQLTGRILIHPSRVVRIMGEDHPDPNAVPDGWGESVLQPVYEAVKNAGLVSASGAQLISELKVDVLRIPDLTEQLGDKETSDLLTARLAYGMMSKSSVNALVLDKEDEWERINANLAGLPDIIKQYLMIASGAADIPATRMLGQSPTGLNATGESDTRNYYDRVGSEQVNFLSPALNTLDEVVIRSALGSRDDNIFYTWNPLWQMTDAELADIAKKKADVVKADVDMMLIPTDALATVRINQVIEDEFYPGIEAAMEDSDGEVVNPKLEAQLEMTRMKGEQMLQAGEHLAKLQKQLPKPKSTKDWRLDAGFDHNQPRSETGEWTAGGAGARRFEQKGTIRQALAAMRGKSPTQVNKIVREWAGGNWTTPLSSKDFEKVDEYVSVGESINKALRGYRKLDADDKKNLRDINSVFAKSRLNKDSILWRGVEGSKVNAASFKGAVGKVIELNGITSTSKDPSVAAGFGGTVMEIFAPKGSKAIDVSVQTGGYEREVMLPHKSKFRVESVEGKRVRLRLVG